MDGRRGRKDATHCTDITTAKQNMILNMTKALHDNVFRALPSTYILKKLYG
jgi:hypothetical protein